MALRTFKKFTIVAGGTPQPCVGTTIVGSLGPTADRDAVYTIQVADSTVFRAKTDWAIIGKPSTGEDRVFVLAVTDSTHIVVQGGLKNSYLTGAYIRPSFQVNSSYVQTTMGNAGAIYIGNTDAMVKATGAFCVAILQAVSSGQPVEFRDGRSGLANADDCAQLWVDGTTADSYLPSFGVV